MTTSPTITYTLEEFLMRFEQKIDRQFADLKTELKQDIAAVKKDVADLRTELKQDITAVKKDVADLRTELKQEVKELSQKVSDLSGDVKALDERIKGMDKRLENLEFIVRGGIVSFLAGFIGLILKVLGIIPNIKLL